LFFHEGETIVPDQTPQPLKVIFQSKPFATGLTGVGTVQFQENGVAIQGNMTSGAASLIGVVLFVVSLVVGFLAGFSNVGMASAVGIISGGIMLLATSSRNRPVSLLIPYDKVSLSSGEQSITIHSLYAEPYLMTFRLDTADEARFFKEFDLASTRFKANR
jgi:hypothetical protein